MKYKSILLIDDDKDDCEFFEYALREIYQFEYNYLTNPLKALDKLINKNIQPDLIFIDLNMPMMSGIELIKEIKKDKSIKYIPVIFLSTSSMYSKTDAQEMGAEDYIIKPNSFKELTEVILKSIS